MDNLDLLSLNAPDRVAQASGAPMQLPLDLVDEDPDQPRVEFDTEELQELAESIKERGVIAPISVRPHPKQDGRWIVNFGARRLRASKLAGRNLIPAFVDHGFNSYDQVIENEQREGLKPLELAMFIKRELEKGLSRADISRRLSKSKTYVTFACAMIDPPDWLMQAYREGKCRTLVGLYELRKRHEVDPDAVTALLSENEVVSRADIASLRAERTVTGSMSTTTSTNREDGGNGPREPASTHHPVSSPNRERLMPSEVRVSDAAFRLLADFDQRSVEVMVDVAPKDEACIYVRSSDGQIEEVLIPDLQRLRLARR